MNQSCKLYLISFTIFILTICGYGTDVYFSTKTAYESVANMAAEQIFPDNYQVFYLRYLGRHGERYPSFNDVAHMKAVFSKFSPFSPLLEKIFKESKIELDTSRDKSLSPKGIKQLYHIGHRYKERLKRVFNLPELSANQFRFESSCRSRAIHSMISFIEGMFDLHEHSTEIPEIKTFPCENDTIYRFFDFCDGYNKFQICLKDYKNEEKLFLNTPLLWRITDRINDYVKLPSEHQLKPEDVKSIYLLCAYYVSLFNGSLNEGPCQVFDSEAFSAFNYLLDMKSFYKRANAYSLNTRMAIRLFKTIYNSIISALESCPRTCSSKFDCDSKFNGDFGFAHAETLIPLLGYLGLYGPIEKDLIGSDSNLILSSKSFSSNKDNRKFMGGLLSPMAGNIVLTVGCPFDGISEGVVMALLHEQPISLPCCEGTYLNNDKKYPVCSKEQFIKCFQKLTLESNFEEVCSKTYPC